MQILENLPAFKTGDLSCGLCELLIQPIGRVSTVEEAWKLLPAQGEGYVVCADENRRFDPKARVGWLMEAEVCDGQSTTILRSDGVGWSAWRWSERAGNSHRWVQHTFLSSEPGSNRSHILYRQYWTLREEHQLKVWRPIGARFCGFVQEEK